MSNQRSEPSATTARGLPTVYALIDGDGSVIAAGSLSGMRRNFEWEPPMQLVAYPPPIDAEKAREAITEVVKDCVETALANPMVDATALLRNSRDRILAAIERGG